ncbi:penicillin-binding protein [Sphingomonas spermidinifaciens]|uniref:Penicillin-binding protein 1A n=1 Tax=Sphingomonas spermidinifaciens TaxID=1141889 RepID=A0A2A4B8S4_9SPHN|nr:transglycosylase domain-containing protein [Sphingomonas spermidinifaciens]PCD04178.1 penicillin-binding protein [Sphingomonas spermidinifaciens]
MADADANTVNFTLKREAGAGAASWFARLRRRWWFRVLAVLALLGGLGIVVGWLVFARDLPSVDALKAYEPPLPTTIRSADGTPIHTYARERRVELDYAEFPPLLVRAFLAAEDKTFFQHHGVDFPGFAGAVVDYVGKMGTGERARGGSTITQQVAKNLLIGNEYSPTRKVREMILAWRIEDALEKPQILELYLNGIPMGRRSFGVQAAARAYFNKDVDQLALAEMAFLATLPKAPESYGRAANADRALKRRNWVLSEMLRNGFVTDAQYRTARAAPLGLSDRQLPTLQSNAGYFVEEVRRQLIDRYGEKAADGPYSVYDGGLWVRTSLDPRVQQHATDALRRGLLRFDSGRGWSGPIKTIEVGDGWRGPLAASNMTLDFDNWRVGVVVSRGSDSAEIGFADGTTGTMPRRGAQMPVRGKGGTAFAALKPGDVIAVAPEGSQWVLRSIPRVSGGMVVEDPRTGRILALQGGFDASLDSFNRATQAMRQPGSTIKPIVYAAAFEAGMTPATIIVDGPFCVYQGARLGQKCFRNFGNSRGAGPHTIRWGLEQSRNLMTVQAANRTGMEKVVNLMQRIGITDQKYAPYLSYALGAGETTVMRMVNAYSILANNGRALTPSVIDFVQNRRGEVIWPERWRACERCNMPDWDGKPMPRPRIRARQVMDPISAYQMTHVAEGVIQRGTATILRDLGRPIMGKTGTSTGPTDVWFVGGTPQMIAGLYLGYDQPRSLGGYAQGGTVAAPIFKAFATKAWEGMEVLPFRAPPGTRMVRIDRGSGRPVYGAWPTDDPKASVIWEAFKPESEPTRQRRNREAEAQAKAEAAAKAKAAAAAARRQTQQRPSDSDFLQREGGIY